MDQSLNKIFKLIDNLDADETIKEFYKDVLIFEVDNASTSFKRKYNKLVSKYAGDF